MHNLFTDLQTHCVSVKEIVHHKQLYLILSMALALSKLLVLGFWLVGFVFLGISQKVV